MPFIKQTSDGCVVSLWIQPRAGRTRIVEIYNDLLKVAVSAPAIDGRANKEAIAFLAKLLGVAASNVSFLSGEQSRRKRVLIKGLSVDEVRTKLAAA